MVGARHDDGGERTKHRARKRRHDDIGSGRAGVADVFLRGRSDRRAVGDALERWGVLAQLRDDDAGRQVLAALGIDPPLAAARRASLSDGVEPLTLAEFTRWADDVLEGVAYRPPIAAAAEEDVGDAGTPAPDVVVTPLALSLIHI